MRTLGMILVVVGIAMMVITGFNLVTKKKVVDVGPVEINKEKNHPISWSPIIGAALLLGGIAVMASDKKKV
jgi:uncharacterized membrane protein YdcZ (DUF606 family)